MLPVKLLRIPIFAAIACAAFAQTPPLPASVRFLPGPANGLLVNGKVRDAGSVEQDGFGAVAMMHVEIKNGDTLCARGRRFKHGDGDVVQIAEAHGMFLRGVMAGRAHEAENPFARAGGVHRVHSSRSGSAGVT